MAEFGTDCPRFTSKTNWAEPGQPSGQLVEFLLPAHTRLAVTYCENDRTTIILQTIMAVCMAVCNEPRPACVTCEASGLICKLMRTN